jgi:hypothetical protein
MSMREKIARALWAVSAEPEHGDTWERIADKPHGEYYLRHADAALDAMREPDEEMCKAGATYMIEGPGIGGDIKWPDHARLVLQAMIDRARDTPNRHGGGER